MMQTVPILDLECRTLSWHSVPSVLREKWHSVPSTLPVTDSTVALSTQYQASANLWLALQCPSAPVPRRDGHTYGVERVNYGWKFI